jgi:hypothetical protein
MQTTNDGRKKILAVNYDKAQNRHFNMAKYDYFTISPFDYQGDKQECFSFSSPSSSQIEWLMLNTLTQTKTSTSTIT